MSRLRRRAKLIPGRAHWYLIVIRPTGATVWLYDIRTHELIALAAEIPADAIAAGPWTTTHSTRLARLIQERTPS